MLISKVSVQLICVFGLIVAELTFVRFQFIVLLYVLLQALIAGAGKGTLITTENNPLQVLGQFGSADLNGDDPLFCRDRRGTVHLINFIKYQACKSTAWAPPYTSRTGSDTWVGSLSELEWELSCINTKRHRTTILPAMTGLIIQG